jgi:hypothetical protein
MTDREKAMVIDYWRRVFRGERDPLAGTLRHFGMSPENYCDEFFVRLGVFEMSETRH